MSKSQEQKSKQFTLLRNKGLVDRNAKGVWKSIGNGYILDTTSDSVYLYSYTTNFCYKEKNDYLIGLLNSQARFTRSKDTISIFLADFGDKTDQLQIKNDFIKLERMPKNSISHETMQQMASDSLFTLFIETLSENYAFSRERQLNWSAIRQEYGKRISNKTSREELFQIMGEVVSLSKDHHTKIIAEDGTTLQYRGTRSAETVTGAFNKQTEVKQLNDYFSLFFKTNYKNISDSLLLSKGHKVANGQIEWGSLTEKVGYINFYSFTNFTQRGISRKQQLDSVNVHMEQIISELSDKDALILDVSFNFGGYDAAVLSIASFFTAKTQFAYTSQVYANGRFYDESKIYVRPSAKISYTKPVYILMTDISRSAAEGFAMTMKALPHVKLVGTSTMGILSGMLGKSIGKFYLTSSNQRLLSATGTYYEVKGIPPDIDLEVFPKENIFEGHKEAVRRIISFVR